MAQRVSGIKVSVGFASETGPRKRNEDFAGAVFGPELPAPRRDVVAAISDGIGGAKGGREAAEIAVRGFLDGFCDLPETMEVRRAAAIVLNALNGWIHSQSQRDPDLAGMGCTFTALVLRGRIAHVLHVGDTRAYRLSRDRLTCLTTDHVRQVGVGRSSTLTRALGVEPNVDVELQEHPVQKGDLYLICSDGLSDMVEDDDIHLTISTFGANLENATKQLIQLGNDNGGKDNISVVVAEIMESFPAPRGIIDKMLGWFSST